MIHWAVLHATTFSTPSLLFSLWYVFFSLELSVCRVSPAFLSLCVFLQASYLQPSCCIDFIRAYLGVQALGFWLCKAPRDNCIVKGAIQNKLDWIELKPVSMLQPTKPSFPNIIFYRAKCGALTVQQRFHSQPPTSVHFRAGLKKNKQVILSFWIIAAFLELTASRCSLCKELEQPRRLLSRDNIPSFSFRHSQVWPIGKTFRSNFRVDGIWLAGLHCWQTDW